MSREELRDGFMGAMRNAYALDAYFGRIDALFIGDGFRFAPQQCEYWRRHRLAQARRGAADYLKISRSRIATSHQRQGPGAQIEVPAAALAHPSGGAEPHILPDLRHQDRDAL